MAEATLSPPTTDAPAQPNDPGEEPFERALAARLAQGYHIESRGKTDAVLFTRGRRRWFGLVEGSPGRRQRLAVGDDGGLSTERL